MEFLDEYESKPKFLFQSKQSPNQSDLDQTLTPSSYLSSLHKPTLLICLPISIIIFSITFFYFNDLEPLKSMLLWLALSLFLGPFAPPSITAGDIRVGLGPPIKESPKIETFPEIKEKSIRKSVKKVNPAEPAFGIVEKLNPVKRVTFEEKKFDEGEWTDADDEMLKKLMAKHPVGKPGRWEAITEGFKGKHKVDTVIVKAKEFGGRKVDDEDSYQKFLKNRKPVDQRVVDELVSENKESGWSSGEDLALLNALKTFPKEVAMRWEKIAASIPGKTKADCMKRVGELKKDFRSSKAS